jgi:hypothetical protein
MTGNEIIKMITHLFSIFLKNVLCPNSLFSSACINKTWLWMESIIILPGEEKRETVKLFNLLDESNKI